MSTVAPETVFVPPSRGVIPGVDPFIVGLDGLRDSENWLFNSDGYFVPRAGLAQLGQQLAGERVMGFIQYIHDDGAMRTVVVTDKGWWKYLPPPTGGAFQSITGTALTASSSQFPILRTFKLSNTVYLIGVNGKDNMQKWDGSAPTYSVAAGSPPRASCMAINNDHVILANLKSGDVISPAAYDVSATQTFEDGWNGLTQRGIIPDVERIDCLLEMGNQITAAYCSNCIQFAIAQGVQDAPFRWEMREPEFVGIVSPAAAIKGKRGVHYLLCKDFTVQAFDGTRTASLGPHIQSYVKRHMSEDHYHLAHGAYDRTEEKVYFFFIGRDVGTVWRGICIDLKRNYGEYPALFPLKMGTKQLTASGTVKLDNNITRLVTGDSAGKVYQDTGLDDDGTAIPTLFETGLSPWSRRYRTLQNIEHGFLQTQESQAVTVMVGRTNHAQVRFFDVTIGELAGGIGELSGDIFSLSNHGTLDLINAPPYRTGHRRVAAPGSSTARSFSLRYEADVNRAGVVYRGASLALRDRGLR